VYSNLKKYSYFNCEVRYFSITAKFVEFSTSIEILFDLVRKKLHKKSRMESEKRKKLQNK
jgi:hypothetical protein